jgi:hypothetical protein
VVVLSVGGVVVGVVVCAEARLPVASTASAASVTASFLYFIYILLMHANNFCSTCKLHVLWLHYW